MVSIIHAKDLADIARTKRVFIELATCLDFVALSRGVQTELEDHPTAYLPPEGCLHLAALNMQIVGCSVVKRIDQHACELKCLYVWRRFRRRGIGTTLAKTAVDEAGKMGYELMRLTTLPSMKDAISIYRRLGFEVVEAQGDEHAREHRHGLGHGSKALCMELRLESSDQHQAAPVLNPNRQSFS